MKQFVLFLVLILAIILIWLSIKKYNETYKENEWSFIDKVVYINLDERKDRKMEIENELSNKIPKDKIIRFSAIKNSFGHIGCSMSHIKVIEMAINNNWKNILVLEDDAMFYKYNNGYKELKKLILNDPNFDVITLGSVGAKFDKKSGKLYEGQTCTAYIVNNHYYNRLLENFKTGLSNLLTIQNLDNPNDRYLYESKYCIDQYWKLLQKIDNWYIVNPALMVQRPSNSTIVGGKVDYINYFNI